jgi:hypothetical protein
MPTLHRLMMELTASLYPLGLQEAALVVVAEVVLVLVQVEQQPA